MTLLANVTLDATIPDIMTILISINGGTCLAYLLGKKQTLCHPHSVLGKILSQAAQREELHDQLHHLPTCSVKRFKFRFYDSHKPQCQISSCSLLSFLSHIDTQMVYSKRPIIGLCVKAKRNSYISNIQYSHHQGAYLRLYFNSFVMVISCHLMSE